MKTKFLKIFAAFAAMFIVLAAVETSSAQTRRVVRRTVSKQQVEQLLERIEERTDRFSNQLNKSLDRSRIDGTRAEDNINARAGDLEDATDELRREFDDKDSHAENSPKVRKVINAARNVNRIMVRRNFSRQTEQNWAALLGEINALARLFRAGAI